ncbi:unnamed protein product [Camellia sinensis]
MKVSMSGVDRADLILCDLVQEETSTLTASAQNLLQSRWSDIVETEGSEEAVVDRFKYIPDSLFLARARNLVLKLDALPMAGSVHSHGVGGGMADSKVYTPIGGRSGSGGRGGRGGRGQNPVALNPELNVVSAVDNAAPNKSWASVVASNQRSFVKLKYFPPSSSDSTIVVDLPRRESIERWEAYLVGHFLGLLSVEDPWTLIIDDALANSFVTPATDDVKDDHQLSWGMICTGQKRFRKALELLHNVVTATMSTINAIAVEAYKKYILVSLIHLGQLGRCCCYK